MSTFYFVAFDLLFLDRKTLKQSDVFSNPLDSLLSDTARRIRSAEKLIANHQPSDLHNQGPFLEKTAVPNSCKFSDFRIGRYRWQPYRGIFSAHHIEYSSGSSGPETHLVRSFYQIYTVIFGSAFSLV